MALPAKKILPPQIPCKVTDDMVVSEKSTDEIIEIGPEQIIAEDFSSNVQTGLNIANSALSALLCEEDMRDVRLKALFVRRPCGRVPRGGTGERQEYKKKIADEAMGGSPTGDIKRENVVTLRPRFMFFARCLCCSWPESKGVEIITAHSLEEATQIAKTLHKEETDCGSTLGLTVKSPSSERK